LDEAITAYDTDVSTKANNEYALVFAEVAGKTTKLAEKEESLASKNK
jgi:hypothetical protein